MIALPIVPDAPTNNTFIMPPKYLNESM